jgi:hypothetical protein
VITSRSLRQAHPRQSEYESRSRLVVSVLQADRPAMRLGERPHDGQAKATAARAIVTANEPLKDAGPQLRRNAGSIVLHGYRCAGPIRADRHFDLGSGGACG